MPTQLEQELLNLLNNADSPREIVDRFRLGDEELISLALARRIFESRNNLPGHRFRSIDDLAGIRGINMQLLERIINALPSLLELPLNTHPILLLPLRLETRFIKNVLWVRIYPDQIFVNAHEPRLVKEEFDAGKLYHEAITNIADDINDPEEYKRDAWRRLVQILGPERAAWTAKVFADNADDPHSINIRPEAEGWIIPPKLEGLPDRFVVYAYRGKDLIHCKAGERIRSDLSLMASPSQNGGLFDQSSRWVTDLRKAKNDGMAVRIKDLSETDLKDGFTRLVVAGMRHGTPEEGKAAIEQLIENHHFSTGLGFLKPGTPTNNTGTAESGHSETAEDREGSYDTEFVGPSNWDEPRINAQRMGRALGLGHGTEVLRYLTYAGESSDTYAREMQIALWPVTGDYFLRYLLPGLVTEQALHNLADHFIDFVRGGGPLPSIRVENQPYGVLPVTGVRPKSQSNPLGWQASAFDSNADGARFDTKLHYILYRLLRKWLVWARNPERVPRIAETEDPDKELLNILAMEPVSVEYRTRPFVDKGLVGYLLGSMSNYIFGPDTPYADHTPYYWIHKWDETWREHRVQQAQEWGQLTGENASRFEDSDLFELFAWWNDSELDMGLTQDDQEHPLDYLRILCEGKDTGGAQTLLREMLWRSLKLAPDSSIEPVEVRDAICRLAAPALLDFFNTVSEPEQIVQRIVDDPGHGIGPPSAYGVRPSLASRILQVREQLPEKKFTGLEQIDEIFAVGEDTLHDILYAFRDQAVQPDIALLFRQALDLCTHRLDAWITSLATKRLEAMRADEPTGIYVGAYGYVEDLKPDADERQSEGYLHAPSPGQAKAAAVLHNAYLTHDFRVEGDDHEPPNAFRINLTSERVRRALRILEGIRQGQPLGALLGYQFERVLHERRLDQHIDEFRSAFPIVANKETEPEAGEAMQAVAARNVVDGLSLARWAEDRTRTDIPIPDQAALDVVISLLDQHADAETLRQEVNTLQGNLDAVSDLLLYEGVYQAVQGNYDRSGAALDVLAANAVPPEIESIITPVPGKSAAHRVCLILQESDVEPVGRRAQAEPRLAAWLADLVGGLDVIGCQFGFNSPRININEPEDIDEAKANLVSIPDVSSAEAEKIIAYREEHGPFRSLAAIEDIGGIDEPTKLALVRWGMTGIDSDEDLFYTRINVNTATHDELMLLPGIGEDKATGIINGRPYRLLEELQQVDGIGDALVNQIRPWATTAVNTLSLAQLNIQAIDLFYMSALLPQTAGMREAASDPLPAETTEIEQRIGYWVRHEFGLRHDAPVDISFERSANYSYGVDEVLELCRQLLNTLGSGRTLRPVSFTVSAETEGTNFSETDITEMTTRVHDTIESVNSLRDELSIQVGDGTGDTITREMLIEHLFEVSLYGVSGAIPPGRNDPELEQRQANVLSELDKRLAESTRLVDGLPALAAAPDRQIDALTNAMKTLMGSSFIVVPIFEPSKVTELKAAFSHQRELLAGLDESRIRLWLQQAAQAHPALYDLEDTLITTEIWHQTVRGSTVAPMTLHVAQLPYSEESQWIALDDGERGARINADTASDRGLVSIVAALAGSDKVFDQEDTRIAGLLIDQWDEVIPHDVVTTGVSFNYDGPNTQAPQSLLLAVPSQRTRAERRWTLDEIAEIVSDTMNLAKVRSVDPDAMGAIEEADSGETGVGLMFPALMLPTDPEKPGWARETAFGSIDDWMDALLPRELCATFEQYTLTENLGDQFEFRNFTFSSGNDFIVARLLAPGELTGDGPVRMCIFSSGDLEIELPAPANNVLLRTGWMDSMQNIELYNDSNERIDQAIDTSNTRPAGLLRAPSLIIPVNRLDVTLSSLGIKKIKITGDNVVKFILTVANLD